MASFIKFIAGVVTALVVLIGVLLVMDGRNAPPTDPITAQEEEILRTDDGDPFVAYEPNDPEMNAAIKSARATLDTFLASPEFELDTAALKAALPHDNGAEHIFMLDVRRDGDLFEGTIGNAPVYLPGLRQGDRHRFGYDQISDWTYSTGGKIHGGYTVRAMLSRLPQAEADALAARLAPLP